MELMFDDVLGGEGVPNIRGRLGICSPTALEASSSDSPLWETYDLLSVLCDLTGKGVARRNRSVVDATEVSVSPPSEKADVVDSGKGGLVSEKALSS